MTNASEHLPRPHRLQVRLVASALALLPALSLYSSPARAQTPPPPATNGTIVNVAGTSPGFAGDGGPATGAKLSHPTDVAFRSDGSLLVADRDNDRVRIVNADGTITTDSGDNNGASDCQDASGHGELAAPEGVTWPVPGGGYLITDTNVNCIMRRTSGGLVRVAGAADGLPGLSGDHGPAESARLDDPSDVAVGPDGSLYIADTGNNRIRQVLPGGAIVTFAGTTQGFSGDGGPAIDAQLDAPRDVSIAADGTVLIADTGNHRVRRVAPDGTITTVAGGDPGAGLATDGNPALTGSLDAPTSITRLTNGGFLVADAGDARVRRVTPLGAILTAAGTTPGLTGDGGPANQAELSDPEGITARPGGGFVIADSDNSRVRAVSDVGAIPPAVLHRSYDVAPVGGSVTVQPAGAPAPLPLAENDIVPLGSTVDATHGRLMIDTQRVTGNLDPATVFEGAFAVSQTTDADPITDLTMTGPLACPTARRAAAFTTPAAPIAIAARAKKRKPGKHKRRLWGRAHGRYRIKGHYVSALERGTTWHVDDACGSSTVYVTRDSVTARNLITGKRRVVTAGHHLTVFGP